MRGMAVGGWEGVDALLVENQRLFQRPCFFSHKNERKKRTKTKQKTKQTKQYIE